MEHDDSGIRRAGMAGVLFGIGLGGFVDGIVLHQIAQWHQMLSTVLPPTELSAMEVNMRWDGFFHLFVLLVTIAGLVALWSVARRPVALPGWQWFGGLLLLGWGLFNLVEGVINHHLLGIHHVRYVDDVMGGEPHLGWGLGFILAGGVLFIALGWLLARGGLRRFREEVSHRSV